MRFSRLLCGIVAVAMLPVILYAQKKDDDKYVRLMSAQAVSTFEEFGKTYRRADGPARFLHNDTWLICDTAIWDVDLQVIYALGHVSIEQENTELRSDKLTYFIEKDLAEFRGSVVELVDKDNNTLRTRNLDYNTKDSTAIFRSGASMRDKDGQIIESLDGTYESKLHLFTFENEVNMFSDSVFVRTSRLLYNSDLSLATFPNYVDAWNEDRMMSGGNGHYNNKTEKFFFTDNVHTMNTEKEGWCDSLYFYRGTKELELMGNAQLTDSAKAVTGLAGYIHFQDSLSLTTMLKDPLLLVDTVFVRADTLKFWKVMKMHLDSLEVDAAKTRMKELGDDPVANIRAKAAEEAEKRRQEALENDPNAPPSVKKGAGKKNNDNEEDNSEEEVASQAGLEPSVPDAVADSLGVDTVDSLSIHDTLGAVIPSGPVYSAADSVELSHIYGHGKVKVFRSDMQMVCDSLVYTDIDSLARLYLNPVVWNSPTHQYNADSIFIAVHDQRIDRANLLSNAFIHIEEEADRYYDQIKGTEMTAFFDENGQLRRFDALGGANALFYLREKDDVSLANRSEATMLSANFKEGELKSIYYYENPTSNAFPVPQMGREDKYIKGFNWTPDLRPRDVGDLSSRTARGSQRKSYERHEKAAFKQTGIYFPGYIAGIYRQIEISDSLKLVREENERIRQEQKERDRALKEAAEKADSLGVKDSVDTVLDSLDAVVDSLGNVLDSLGVRLDSLGAGQDSLAASLDSAIIRTARELKAEERALKRAERRAAFEAKRKAAQEKREARWAELDARDAMRQAARDARKREKREKKIRQQIARLEKEKAREDALIEMYKAKYLKKSLPTE